MRRNTKDTFKFNEEESINLKSFYNKLIQILRYRENFINEEVKIMHY